MNENEIKNDYVILDGIYKILENKAKEAEEKKYLYKEIDQKRGEEEVKDKRKEIQKEELKNTFEKTYSDERLKKILPKMKLPVTIFSDHKEMPMHYEADWGLDLDISKGNIELKYWIDGRDRDDKTHEKVYSKESSSELPQFLVDKLNYTAGRFFSQLNNALLKAEFKT